MVLLLDASSKLVTNAWTDIQGYANSVVDRYNINPNVNCIRVGVIIYSDNAVVSIELNRYSDRSSLKQAIIQLRLLNGGSNLANAFSMLRSRVLPTIRSTANLVAIVVTDQIQASNQLTNESNSLKSAGVRIIAVGINRSNRVDRNTLFGISTNNYAIIVNDYTQLSPTLNRVVLQWGCYQAIITTTPAPAIGTYCFANISTFFAKKIKSRHNLRLLLRQTNFFTLSVPLDYITSS